MIQWLDDNHTSFLRDVYIRFSKVEHGTVTVDWRKFLDSVEQPLLEAMYRDTDFHELIVEEVMQELDLEGPLSVVADGLRDPVI